MVTGAPMVSVRGLCVRVPQFALRNVAFTVQPGEYFVLLGPTGSGKTMLIETLCGLNTPRAGTVWIDGRDVTRLDPAQRNIGYVPQDYALLPFKTVHENIAFGLHARRLPKAEINARTAEMLALLNITHLARRFPGRLSGGERQRTALGRALAIHPSVLLLDEPFSAIDEGMREELGLDIRIVLQRVGATTLHICHNLEEAMRLGDRLAVMRDGAIVQVGTPVELLERPRNLFVARFLRLPNLSAGEVRADATGTAFYLGDTRLCDTLLPPGPAVAVIPQHAIALSHARPTATADRRCFATIIQPGLPRAIRPELRLAGEVTLTLPGIFPEADWPAGATVYVSFAPAALHLLPHEDALPPRPDGQLTATR